MNLEKINNQIEGLQLLKDTIIECSNEKQSTIEGITAQYYIEMQNIKSVAIRMNEDGYRIISERGKKKYDASDIKDIIESRENTTYIFQIAKLLFCYNQEKYKTNELIIRLKTIKK